MPAEKGRPAGELLHDRERVQQEAPAGASDEVAAPAPPAPVPGRKKYVVTDPDGNQHVTYDGHEARELQAFGHRLRKR